jgi:NTP pyrophosphatase (non-canonical NTP hydrolase)
MLNELAKQIYDNASEKGWHDKPVAFGDAITNIHGELSEAWEDYRNNKPLNEVFYKCKSKQVCCNMKDGICLTAPFCNYITRCQHAKPCGIPSEFADVLIRVLDNCYMYDIDIDKVVQEKMEFNKTRPFKHGGKII